LILKRLKESHEDSGNSSSFGWDHTHDGSNVDSDRHHNTDKHGGVGFNDGVVVESNGTVEEYKPQVDSNSNKELKLIELSPDLRELRVSFVSKLMHALDVTSKFRVASVLGIDFTELRHLFGKLADLALTPRLLCRVAISFQVSLKLVEILHKVSVEFVNVLVGVERRMEHSQVGEGE
jgi:hypothetical protein